MTTTCRAAADGRRPDPVVRRHAGRRPVPGRSDGRLHLGSAARPTCSSALNTALGVPNFTFNFDMTAGVGFRSDARAEPARRSSRLNDAAGVSFTGHRVSVTSGVGQRIHGAARRAGSPATPHSASGDDAGAAELGRRVADNLRERRRVSHLSLDELAKLSGRQPRGPLPDRNLQDQPVAERVVEGRGRSGHPVRGADRRPARVGVAVAPQRGPGSQVGRRQDGKPPAGPLRRRPRRRGLRAPARSATRHTPPNPTPPAPASS